MNRRGLLAVGGVGLAAAAAGALWWRREANAEAPEGFWTMRFERPEGGELAFAALRGRPLLLNFWATWCVPCITELPLLNAFHRARSAAGWQVVGLAIDSPTPVRAFLAKRPLDFAVGLAGMEGVGLTRALGNAEGALPFSVVFAADGRIVARKLGAVKPAELERWAAGQA